MEQIGVKSRLLIIFLSFVSQFCFADEFIEIRKLNPPKLQVKNLGRKIIGYRPMRTGSPAMSLEVVGDKVIVSNYGHGGSGWSLGPGSAKYVANLLEQNTYAQKLGKNEPVMIIGAGAMGMLTALELHNRGYNNITIVAEEYDNLTSHVACGILAPLSMDNLPELQEHIDQIFIDSYRFYKNIALKRNEQFKNGSRILSAYFMSREDSGLEPYVGKVMQPGKNVVVDFQNGTTRKMVAYDDGIFIETENMMHSLRALLKETNAKFEQRKVFDIAAVKEKIVFNCSGNGAKELVNDQKMIPIQGHLVMLKEQDPADVDYMMLVYLNESKNQKDQQVIRLFYIFPKQSFGAPDNDIGVIGGTFIEVSDFNTPNLEEFDLILKNTKDFYGITSGADKFSFENLNVDRKKKNLLCYGL